MQAVVQLHANSKAQPEDGRRPRVGLVIPTLNEEEPIAHVIRSIPRDVVDDVIVADSGSDDHTVERAHAAGARVVVESRRGLWSGLRRRRTSGARVRHYRLSRWRWQ